MDRSALDAPSFPMQVEDRRFVELYTRLAPHGGMLSGDELRCIHKASNSGNALGLALLRREVAALKWRHRLWFPIFQFDLPAWKPVRCMDAVVTELFPVLQDFELVEWFLTPNTWLQNRRPLQVLRVEPEQVRWAAQADRFLIAC